MCSAVPTIFQWISKETYGGDNDIHDVFAHIGEVMELCFQNIIDTPTSYESVWFCFIFFLLMNDQYPTHIHTLRHCISPFSFNTSVCCTAHSQRKPHHAHVCVSFYLVYFWRFCGRNRALWIVSDLFATWYFYPLFHFSVSTRVYT